MRILSVLLTLACLTPSGFAQGEARQAERMRYQACIARTGEDPGAALQEAQTWRIEGGGWPAEVCEAQAFIALGDHAVGAAILEELAGERRPGMVAEERVDFLTLAAESRAAIGETGRALANYDAALAIDPSAILTRAGRAGLNRDLEDWPALGRDAEDLVRRVPGLATGWYLRGVFRLETGDLDGAWADMQAARERAPDRIDILVLRGRINEARRLEGG
ncbi:tetratricopeptide repeat protein [Maricaulis sp.]|uniref:tetratricopeptide repeat protein n=1 Tax=Maricaulis sp. TaxID=1486257 RepID=UPI002610113B|nr:tetratricopeptide repeat protein [Maricaulis sp.]